MIRQTYLIFLISLTLAGCSGKGDMAHVIVETTKFASEKGITVKDWSWSGGKFSVQFSTTAQYSGTWNMFVQAFDANGKAIGSELRFLNSNMGANKTEWSQIPDLKLTEKTAKVVFDIQSATKLQRDPHY